MLLIALRVVGWVLGGMGAGAWAQESAPSQPRFPFDPSVASSESLLPPLPPNIVFILADDLGYGELGSYGQTKIRTPHLDRLAAEGMRFTRGYTGAPVCAPARCVLLTGQSSPRAQIRGNRDNARYGEGEEGQWPLRAGTPTIASLLRAAGYATGGFGKWGLGNATNSGNPNALGFDTFYGYYCQRVAHSYFPPYLNHNQRREALNTPPVPGHFRVPDEETSVDFARFQGRVYAPDRILTEALQFLREHRDQRFFLYLPFVEPHVAMQPPPEWVEAYPEEWDELPYLGRRGYTPHPRPRAGYAAMISDLDEHVGTVLAELEALGLAQDTLVVFTSDNGPTHDVGGVDTAFFDSTGGLRGRKGSLWEGGLRVPWIVRWPGRIPRGSLCHRPAAFEDWLPTLVSLAGAEVPADLPGESLFDCLVLGKQGPRAKPLLWEFHGYGGQQAVLFPEGFKAIRQRLRKGPEAWQLYHLKEDPSETRDLAAQHPEWIARAEALFAEHRTVNPDFPLPLLDETASGKGSSSD